MPLFRDASASTHVRAGVGGRVRLCVATSDWALMRRRDRQGETWDLEIFDLCMTFDRIYGSDGFIVNFTWGSMTFRKPETLPAQLALV